MDNFINVHFERFLKSDKGNKLHFQILMYRKKALPNGRAFHYYKYIIFTF